MSGSEPRRPRKGRGAGSNPANRYESASREALDDGWGSLEEQPALRTSLEPDASRSILAWNRSPDVPFDRSINPYRGCEHGCIYCYARPSHSQLGYSPGLDFESRIVYKPDAARRLREELGRPGYRCAPIALGGNTDIYQPAERRLGITRSLLQVLAEHRHPVYLITKSALVERDLDLLTDLAADNLVEVRVSVTTLDRHLARHLEPRATAPHRRLEAVRRLSAAGIPTGVLVAPVIPVLTDHELERILAAAREAGAGYARYILLRLPGEVRGLFRDWLADHRPDAAEHVMSRIRETRAGAENDAAFGRRMRGTGQFAELLAERFRLASRRLGFGPSPELRTDLFGVPGAGHQLDLI